MSVATGFSKWGLSSGTMSATLLTAQIAGASRPTDVFSPRRLSLRGLPSLARMNMKVAIDIVGDRLAPGQGSAEQTPPGQARVVRSGTERTGVYGDEAGGLHAVSLRCTHLGCLLRFNDAERSWDCPCHGSSECILADGRSTPRPCRSGPALSLL